MTFTQTIRNRDTMLRVVSMISVIGYVACVIMGSLQGARIAGLIFACSTAVEIADNPEIERPKGTAMIAIAAFMLPLEGGAHWIIDELTQTSFVEIGIGVYLFAALMQMTKRSPT